VTAADIEENDQVQVINKDLYIATIDAATGELDIEFTVEQGRGYVPVESREQEKYELGVLAVDAIYTPIRAAYFNVSSVRVGQLTNFDRLEMSIETNGTLDGKEAFDLASRILVEHFAVLLTAPLAQIGVINDTETGETTDEDEQVQAEENNESTAHITVTGDADTTSANTDVPDLDNLPLSARARNALLKNGITTVAALKDMPNEKIETLPGLGKKTAQEIMMLLGRE
jgi:DNA-directed RNA polymerase subunit alpha